MMKHKCVSCGEYLEYRVEEVFCSNCGLKNYKYLTKHKGNSISSIVAAHLAYLFNKYPTYLYFIMDNYNGVGEIYKNVVRLDMSTLDGTYWRSDKEVVIRIDANIYDITKQVDIEKTLGIRTGAKRSSLQYTLALKDFLKDAPIDGINMHYTKDDVIENMRHEILNGIVGLHFKETTKDVYDEWVNVHKKIESILECVQPHEKQILPRRRKGC